MKFITNNPWLWTKTRNIIQGKFQNIEELLHPIVKEKNQIWIDLGCGTGQFTSYFSSQKYIGVDIDISRIQYAQRKYKNYFFTNTSLQNIKQENKNISGVLASLIFHHLNENESIKLLKEVNSVLLNIGAIVVIEWIKDKQQNTKLDLLAYKIEKPFFRTKDQIIQLLYQANFKNIEYQKLENSRFTFGFFYAIK